jgi:acyl-CoA thioesterase-1
MEAARRDASGVRTILILGDSLTDGFGLTRSQAYPALLAQKLNAAGYKNFEVINAGVSGDTTAGGVRRIPKYLTRNIDIFIVELGINDAFRGVPIEQMRTNLQMIIDQVRAKNPSVAIVIAGMQLPIGGDAYVQAFGQMFSELAEKNHAALLPYLLQGVGGDPSLNLPDYIHPNAAGHRIVAQNVWRVLEPLLAKTTATTPARVN